MDGCGRCAVSGNRGLGVEVGRGEHDEFGIRDVADILIEFRRMDL